MAGVLSSQVRSTKETSAAASPILLGRTVNGLLGSCGGVDGGHETPLDAEFVIEDLGDRGKAVGGAGSVGDDVLTSVGGVVHTIDEHRSGILGRSGHDNFLGSSLDVFASGLVGEEETGGLDDDLSADLIPLQVGGIHLGGDTDALSVDDEIATLDLDVALELAMD